MKFRQKIILFSSLAIALIPVPTLATVDNKLVVTWLVFVCLCVAYAIYRRSVGEELLVALFFALVVTSYKATVYTGNNLLIGHINVYPLILWTAGLVALREIYKRLRVSYRWVVVSIIYVSALFCLEYIGYYLLGIRSAESSPSFFGLGIIHGSLFIYWFYICAGPLYLLATDYLRVK
ncbi:MAG: hypothetical protein Q7S32_01950 [bacterium]|nr:hypothetical protein [bacterium]